MAYLVDSIGSSASRNRDISPIAPKGLTREMADNYEDLDDRTPSISHWQIGGGLNLTVSETRTC